MMNPAEEVLQIPELLEGITAHLPLLDILRLVRVNSFCYRNVRSSNRIKRQLYYLPPEKGVGNRDDEDLEGSGSDDDSQDNADQVGGPAQAGLGQAQVPNPNRRTLNLQGPRRHAGIHNYPEHEPWPHLLRLDKLNPLLSTIFPGCALRNLSNNMALLCIAKSTQRDARLSRRNVPNAPLSNRTVRHSWKAMLFTTQMCSRIALHPAVLYQPCRKKNIDFEGNELGPVAPYRHHTAGTHGDDDADGWTSRGWHMDLKSNKKLMDGLAEIGENVPYGYSVGMFTPDHWTEYLARRRNETCDGWIWGQSLQDFGSVGPWKKDTLPRWGHFEEEVMAEDGLVRCGQIGREIEAANWCWWILKLTPLENSAI